MSRNQRDEPTQPAVADISSVDSGSGGNDATHVTAINLIINGLEDTGTITRS